MSDASGGQREFVGRGMARIFGAPISWIALFGALMGGLSIIPMIFYFTGGGFVSVGIAIFAPLSGLILGPWAGCLTGLIGGIIGLFVSPASYPLGAIDVVFSGALGPLFFGLVHPRYRKFAIPFFIVNIIIMQLVPYYIPGKAGGFEQMTNPVTYFLTYIWGPIGFLIYLFAAKSIWKAMVNPNRLKCIGAYFLHVFMALCQYAMPWLWIYMLVLHFPVQMAEFMNYTFWVTIIAMGASSGVVAALLVGAIEQTGLPHVIGSVLDREGY